MAYGRRRRGRTRTGRRGRRGRRSVVPWSRKKYCITPADAYTYARRGMRYLSGLVNSEKFTASYTISSQDLSSDNPYSLHMTGVAIGDASFNRTGNSIFVRGLNIRATLTQSNNVRSYARVIIVRDTQQVGDTSPTADDVLNTVDINSFLDDNTKGRFDILFNQVYALDGTGTGNSSMRTININKTMRSHVRFNGSAATDIQRNGLYLFAFSDQTDASGTEPVLSGFVRLYYHDN